MSAWENNQSRKNAANLTRNLKKKEEIPAERLVLLSPICFQSPAAGQNALGPAHHPHWAHTHITQSWERRTSARAQLEPAVVLARSWSSAELSSNFGGRLRERNSGGTVFFMLHNTLNKSKKMRPGPEMYLPRFDPVAKPDLIWPQNIQFSNII